MAGASAQIELLIFDLDGTLVDSRMDIANSVNYMRRRLSLEPLPVEVIASFIGEGAAALVRRALGQQASESQVKEALDIFLPHYAQHLLDNTAQYPQVSETLAELVRRKKLLAVLTNKPTEMTRRILEGFELARLFALILGGDSFERKKPDPMGVHYIINAVGSSPERTLMIGDLPNDILTGRNAGAWTCGVTYGLAGERVAEAQPDFLIHRIGELLDIIKNA